MSDQPEPEAQPQTPPEALILSLEALIVESAGLISTVRTGDWDHYMIHHHGIWDTLAQLTIARANLLRDDCIENSRRSTKETGWRGA